MTMEPGVNASVPGITIVCCALITTLGHLVSCVAPPQLTITYVPISGKAPSVTLIKPPS